MAIVSLKVEMDLHYRKNLNGSYSAWYEPKVIVLPPLMVGVAGICGL